ncbi:matrix metalloproteinase-2-like isoform X2 [Belonocnema kinseyi]|uniref:matrix metalloproteinase-2-like isoform X2 n=1 Tax=Belonocnema kinseyi TaxID=2817044 RepID=UPI00143D7340|nr:matrix metalloproteinase-2-like isoform X2 [Belonocnema kinseyi]
MNHQLTLLLLISLCITEDINSAPVSISNLLAERLSLSTKTIKFMKMFGYLPSNERSESLYKENALVDAIKNLQKFGNIPMSGRIDNETSKLMKTPRCGVADIQLKGSRRKRYIVGSEGWKKGEVTYYLKNKNCHFSIANWSPKLKERAVIDEMQRAFDAWSDYSRLNFRSVTNPNADIIISFGQGSHGDGYPFDGPGNILAHAFFPYELGSFGGDIHFDNDEKWEIRPSNPYDGTDFFSVAVHELGHSLGLSHSTIPTSIMFPYYKGYTTAFQLDYDDLLGLYELYTHQKGEQDYTTTRTTSEVDITESTTEFEIESTSSSDTSEFETAVSTTTQKPNFQNITFIGDYETVEEHRLHESRNGQTIFENFTIPDICEGNFDTVSVFRNELFIFKGEYLWRFIQRGRLDNDYPVKFHQLFHGLPSDVTKIDAAYERQTDSSIVLFSGSKYWIYNGDKFSDDSPRPLSDYGISVYIDKIDTALVWPKTEKTYLFRGDSFWTINETLMTLDSNYTESITKLSGIPTNVDAALTWTDGAVYFFKGKYFWKFNVNFHKIEDSYPLLSPEYWIGCQD